jgi:hypothetical protein
MDSTEITQRTTANEELPRYLQMAADMLHPIGNPPKGDPLEVHPSLLCFLIEHREQMFFKGTEIPSHTYIWFMIERWKKENPSINPYYI